MKKFEYATLNIENNVHNDTGIYSHTHTDTSVAEEDANRWGREGWELVSVSNGLAWFKRQLDD